MTMPAEQWDAKAAAVIAEFRANGGVVGGEFAGFPLLLLHTRDRNDGRERVNAVMYRQEDDRRIIFATHSGLPYDPEWFGNLMHHGGAEIEIGAGRESVVAQRIDGPERDRLYAAQTADWAFFATYATSTTREIPVVALTPVDDPAAPATT